jgi:hypothetical protein
LSKKQVIHALTLQPASYEELPEHLKKDRDIVNAVLKQDWTLMRIMSGKINLSLSDMYTIIQHEEWYYVPEKIGNDDAATLGLPWSSYRHNLNLCVEGIKRDRRIIRHVSRINKGHPRLVYEAMKCYEDIGKGMIDPLKTAPYRWCNMNVLAKNLAMMHEVPTKHNLRSILLSHFIDRFSKAHSSKSIGISRVYCILKKNVDLFHKFLKYYNHIMYTLCSCPCIEQNHLPLLTRTIVKSQHNRCVHWLHQKWCLYQIP